MNIPDTDVPRKRGGGRPLGVTNYGGSFSLIAKEMKAKGIDWRAELVEAYKTYKAGGDKGLLTFWTEILPYLTLTLAERHTRGMAPKRPYKRSISTFAIAKLAEAEGRK